MNPDEAAVADPTPASRRPASGRIFEGHRRVRLGDVRPSGRLRLDAVARYLQDLSADDTADADLPDAEAWVVRRTVIEVPVFPRYLEHIDLATWCSGTGSHYAERRVAIRGAGEAARGVVDGTTLWVHVDPRTGRPRRLSDGFMDRFGAAAGGRKVSARRRHGDPPAQAASRPWPLRATDLDVWGHVNNAAYWEVVEEALAARPDLRAPLRAELEHRTAIERGAQVEWVTQEGDGGLALWVLADGAVVATAVVRPIT